MLQNIKKTYENHYKDHGYDILTNFSGRVGLNSELRNSNGMGLINKNCFYFFVRNYRFIKNSDLNNSNMFPCPSVDKRLFNSFLIEFEELDQDTINVILIFMYL